MITGYLIGDQAVVKRLQGLPADIRKRLEATISRLTIKLQSKVKDEKLSGQVLKNRTGTLRRSINKKITVTDTSIIGSVGTNVSYAKYQELGFHGSENIREHLRHISQAFGRPIEPMDVTVHSHTRKVDYAGHPFLRPALREMSDQIRADIDAALRAAARDGL